MMIKRGDAVLRDDGLVHRVIIMGTGVKTDGRIDFYSYDTACGHICPLAWDERPHRHEGVVTCMGCIANESP